MVRNLFTSSFSLILSFTSREAVVKVVKLQSSIKGRSTLI